MRAGAIDQEADRMSGPRYAEPERLHRRALLVLAAAAALAVGNVIAVTSPFRTEWKAARST
jgi:hypothetical protein